MEVSFFALIAIEFSTNHTDQSRRIKLHVHTNLLKHALAQHNPQLYIKLLKRNGTILARTRQEITLYTLCKVSAEIHCSDYIKDYSRHCDVSVVTSESAIARA